MQEKQWGLEKERLEAQLAKAASELGATQEKLAERKQDLEYFREEAAREKLAKEKYMVELGKYKPLADTVKEKQQTHVQNLEELYDGKQ